MPPVVTGNVIPKSPVQVIIDSRLELDCLN